MLNCNSQYRGYMEKDVKAKIQKRNADITISSSGTEVGKRVVFSVIQSDM